jgi:hypothetical protein
MGGYVIWINEAKDRPKTHEKLITQINGMLYNIISTGTNI